MIVLLDNGHGGLINGTYQTPGKRSPVWNDGSQLFEGEFNRAIVNGIIEELTRRKIKYVNIAPEYRDVTLQTRVNRANHYPARASFYLSIHANAAPPHVAGQADGYEVYTSPGSTKSDKIATIFGLEFKKIFPNRALRHDFSDGDLDKEAKFFVLKKTRMPAILTENFFMDNEDECRNILMTRQGRDKIVQYHMNGILRVQNEIF